MLRITAYADRLLEDLEGLDWASSIKDMQRNWIGRSEGAIIRFPLPSGELRPARRDWLLLMHIPFFTAAPFSVLFASLYRPEAQALIMARQEAAGCNAPKKQIVAGRNGTL